MVYVNQKWKPKKTKTDALEQWQEDLINISKESFGKDDPELLKAQEKRQQDIDKLRALDNLEPIYLQGRCSGVVTLPLLLSGVYINRKIASEMFYFDIKNVINFTVMMRALLVGCFYSSIKDKGDYYIEKLNEIKDLYNKCPENTWNLDWENIEETPKPVKMINVGQIIEVGHHIYQMLIPLKYNDSPSFVINDNSSIQPLGKFTTVNNEALESNKNPKPIIF